MKLYKSFLNQFFPGIKKIQPFIDKCNLEGINFPSDKNDWQKFGKNNLAVALNDFYDQKEKIYPA